MKVLLSVLGIVVGILLFRWKFFQREKGTRVPNAKKGKTGQRVYNLKREVYESGNDWYADYEASISCPNCDMQYEVEKRRLVHVAYNPFVGGDREDLGEVKTDLETWNEKCRVCLQWYNLTQDNIKKVLAFAKKEIKKGI